MQFDGLFLPIPTHVFCKNSTTRTVNHILQVWGDMVCSTLIPLHCILFISEPLDERLVKLISFSNSKGKRLEKDDRLRHSPLISQINTRCSQVSGNECSFPTRNYSIPAFSKHLLSVMWTLLFDTSLVSPAKSLYHHFWIWMYFLSYLLKNFFTTSNWVKSILQTCGTCSPLPFSKGQH